MALGSALIYVRVSEVVHPPPVAQTMPAVQQASQDEPSAAPQAQDTSDHTVTPASPVQKAHAKRHTVVASAKPQPVRIHAAPLPTPPAIATVDVAKDTPPVMPAAPAVAPVHVNEDTQDAAAQPEPQPQSSPSVQQQYSPAPAPDSAHQPHVVTLQAGTNLNVRLLETLSTNHNYTGDTFRGTLESPIVLDGFIIADKGSKVLGRIVNAQKAGRIEGLSDLTLALSEINTTDGQRVRIETSSFDKKGPNSMGEDSAKIAGGAALGAIIGAMAGGGKGAAIGAGAGGAAGTGTVLATRGKPAVIPSETRLSFRLTNPVTITEKLNY